MSNHVERTSVSPYYKKSSDQTKIFLLPGKIKGLNIIKVRYSFEDRN